MLYLDSAGFGVNHERESVAFHQTVRGGGVQGLELLMLVAEDVDKESAITMLQLQAGGEFFSAFEFLAVTPGVLEQAGADLRARAAEALLPLRTSYYARDVSRLLERLDSLP